MDRKVRGILSPVRLPVPPLQHVLVQKTTGCFASRSINSIVAIEARSCPPTFQLVSAAQTTSPDSGRRSARPS